MVDQTADQRLLLGLLARGEPVPEDLALVLEELVLWAGFWGREK